MKIILSVVVLVATWNYASTASAGRDPNHCGHSYHGIFNIGTSPLTKKCGVAICHEDGKLDFEMCPAISVAAGSIIIPEDLSKPFPDCCETVIKAQDVKVCKHEDFGTFNYGRTELKTQCGVADCKEDGTVHVDICPQLSVAAGYIIVPEDLSKPHPHCCEKAVKAPAQQCVNTQYGNYSVGIHALTDHCGAVLCKKNGQLSVNRCPQISVAPGSTIIPEDMSKPFPQCCEKVLTTETVKSCTHEYYGTFNVGSVQLMYNCGVATCKEDGKLNVEVCPDILVGPGSVLIPKDLSKPYPECCEKAGKAPDA